MIKEEEIRKHIVCIFAGEGEDTEKAFKLQYGESSFSGARVWRDGAATAAL